MRFLVLATALVGVLACAPLFTGFAAHAQESSVDVAQHVESAAAKEAGYALEIVFSRKLRKRMATIDRVERIREERFRSSLADEENPYGSILDRGDRSASGDGAIWAGKKLVPGLQDYGVEVLVRAMVDKSMGRAIPDFDGSIRLKLDRIKVDNHSVAFLRASNSYVTGKVEVRDRNGGKIIEDKMTVNLLAGEVEAQGYDGPDFAFADSDGHDRVGPVLAAFVQEALTRAWPEKAAHFPGVVMVRMSGPLMSIRDRSDIRVDR